MESEAPEFTAHRNKLDLRKGTKGRPEEQVRGWLERGGTRGGRWERAVEGEEARRIGGRIGRYGKLLSGG